MKIIMKIVIIPKMIIIDEKYLPCSFLNQSHGDDDDNVDKCYNNVGDENVDYGDDNEDDGDDYLPGSSLNQSEDSES